MPARRRPGAADLSRGDPRGPGRPASHPPPRLQESQQHTHVPGCRGGAVRAEKAGLKRAGCGLGQGLGRGLAWLRAEGCGRGGTSAYGRACAHTRTGELRRTRRGGSRAGEPSVFCASRGKLPDGRAASGPESPCKHTSCPVPKQEPPRPTWGTRRPGTGPAQGRAWNVPEGLHLKCVTVQLHSQHLSRAESVFPKSCALG